ncbi:hypothetical protein PCS76_21855, partial [Acinetobacter baumannii]|nr:hypothetical protein [Acinetobacter baumannii]
IAKGGAPGSQGHIRFLVCYGERILVSGPVKRGKSHVNPRKSSRCRTVRRAAFCYPAAYEPCTVN